jgi:molybdopterin-guanine dinucleotide biosynthesis protein A
MGQDKSKLIVDGSTLAVRSATLLLLVVETAIEVGPGLSGLPTTLEDPPRQGPLAAIAAGCHALRERGHAGGALVIACDLPRLSEQLLRFLVEWDSPGSVVPVVRGRAQPLCAKWGRQDLDNASQFVNQGVHSLRHLSAQPDVVLLDEAIWQHIASDKQFCDIDSPADLLRFRQST